MTRLCFAIALGMSACQCGSVPADDKPAPMPDSDEPDETDEEYRPSVHNWLPDTRWDCHYNYAQNGTLYRVAHTWQFTETEFRTDCGQQIELAYSNGDINQSVHWDAAYWVLTDEGPQYSDALNPWYGMGADVILAEFCPLYQGACTGIEIVFHRDGDDHMVIQIALDGSLENSITCARSGFSK
jgi:hypothetical protein